MKRRPEWYLFNADGVLVDVYTDHALAELDAQILADEDEDGRSFFLAEPDVEPRFGQEYRAR